ncbi:MAG: toxic anion resistance protein [Bdellovibrionia bacterium]
MVDQPDSELENKAERFVDRLMEVRPEDLQAREAKRASVETMSIDLQRKAAEQMALLKEPIRKLTARSEEGGEVANALIQLKEKVEELDPAKFDFEPGWLSRTLGRIPGVGTPMKRYFSRFESAQTVISAIVRSLEGGKDQLQRDNLTLAEDQRQMREMTFKLERAVRMGQLIDTKLASRMERELAQDEAKRKFVGEELLFPLRQRIMDLQQQLAVNQQGVLATEIIIRNNKELIRGVERSLSVTVTALQVAATVALALAHQRIVIDKVDAVNRTTSDLIAGTASRLRTQGVEIQKRATEAQLDMNSLRSAFQDIRGALDDLSRYRMDALPRMASTMLELDRVTTDAEKAIQDMEAGNRRRPDIQIDTDAA